MANQDDHPTSDDTGKPVIDDSGSQIGIIADVEEATVSIDPDPDLTDEIRTLFGGSDAGDTYSVARRKLHRDPSNDLAVFRIENEES